MASDDLINDVFNVRGDIFRIFEVDGGISSERLKGASWIRGGNVPEITWEGRRMSPEEVAKLPGMDGSKA